jgi:hypothetical protein
MELEWSVDHRYQYINYIKIAERVQSGFYQRIRAILLPYLHKDGWYLPDYDLFKNEDFKNRLKNLLSSSFDSKDQTLINYVKEKLDIFPNPADIERDRTILNKVKEDFIYKCSLFFPSFSKVKKTIVIPTAFGTGSSYYFENVNDTYTFYITYRVDKNVEFVYRSILSLMIIIENQHFTDDSMLDWRLRKGISDFITFHTTFNYLFTDYNSPVVEFIDDYKGKLILDSAKYYAKLGFPIMACFSYTDNTILYNQEPVKSLSNKEIEIMKALIDFKSQVLSFDKIGEIYWQGDEEKFSLAALAKMIEKLRNSLELNGIPSTYVRTIRKQGYVLYD